MNIIFTARKNICSTARMNISSKARMRISSKAWIVSGYVMGLSNSNGVKDSIIINNLGHDDGEELCGAGRRDFTTGHIREADGHLGQGQYLEIEQPRR